MIRRFKIAYRMVSLSGQYAPHWNGVSIPYLALRQIYHLLHILAFGFTPMSFPQSTRWSAYNNNVPYQDLVRSSNVVFSSTDQETLIVPNRSTVPLDQDLGNQLSAKPILLQEEEHPHHSLAEGVPIDKRSTHEPPPLFSVCLGQIQAEKIGKNPGKRPTF